jgi:hypothetical protein
VFKFLWRNHWLHYLLIGPIRVLTEPTASTLYLERLDVGVQVSCVGPIRVTHGLGGCVLVALILTSLELMLEACVRMRCEVGPVATQE